MWFTFVTARLFSSLSFQPRLTATLLSSCSVANSLIRRVGLSPTFQSASLAQHPDASVVCGRQRFLGDQEDILLNPIVVIEVLSDSTEAYDRGKKFEHYRQIPTCREYLLVSQKEPRIEQFIRQPNGEWTLKEAAGLNAEIKLPSLGSVLALAEVFAKVQFTPGRLRTRT